MGFFANGIARSVNSTIITLVSKKDCSIKVKDCKPISLVTSLYKIIIEVLSRRLSEVLGDTLTMAKSALFKEQILHAAWVVNEEVDMLREEKKSCV